MENEEIKTEEFKCICGRTFKKKHYLEMHQKSCEVYKDSLKVEEPINIEVQTAEEAKEEEIIQEVVTFVAVEGDSETQESIDETQEGATTTDIENVTKEEVSQIIKDIRSHKTVSKPNLEKLASEFTKVTGKTAWSISCSTAVFAMTNVLKQNGY